MQLIIARNLADTKERGALDSTDFAIGMFFIQAVMSGQIAVLPQHLPPGLYTQAGGNAQGSITSHATGTSGSFSPMQSTFSHSRSIPAQYTGQSHALQPDATGGFSSPFSPQRPAVPPHLPARPNPSHIGSGAFGSPPQWDITPAEKAKSDRFFDNLDPQHRGFIEGDVAVPFMLESNLPGEVLATIWFEFLLGESFS
jgi:epidermal growth factor receptor substrate 15